MQFIMIFLLLYVSHRILNEQGAAKTYSLGYFEVFLEFRFLISEIALQ